jgi:signal transduction histidine kinase
MKTSNNQHPTTNIQHRTSYEWTARIFQIGCWMFDVGCSQKMIPKSIKWRLQLWYGLILVAVLAGFGITAYQLEWGRQMRRIDDELHRRVGVLVNSLHHPPPRGPDFGDQLLSRPPPGQFPDGPPPVFQKNHPLPEFHLPPEDAHFFDATDPHNFYFIIFRDGREIARSLNQPTRLVQTLPHPVNAAPPELPASARPSPTLDKCREIGELLPSGEMIWVGCSIVPELKELDLTALKLLGVGGIILLFGLAGGGWLVSRAIKPIEEISATAVKISAGDLSQRINVAEAESELGQLAGVLNSTFARLEAAFAQQQQFTADAAHELRTPVAVMLTQTQTTLNRERSSPEYRETLEACQRATQRMRRLIESLLELARLDAGQEPMKRIRFDLSRMVQDCVELIRPLADERGVKIHCDLPALEYLGDSERLAQVVTNLLANAIQYNKQNGEVRVTTRLENGSMVLKVSDTGQGINAADLPRVFGRFYRADQSRSSGQTGLGLAISKAIVEAHGGSIEVSSQPEAGTSFTVRLTV